MATYEVDPISRIEGHLGVKVTETAGVITEADVHGNLWRGFENFLLGRDINDAITFTQRICGVCPVPHGMTSTYAADAVLGYSQKHITFVDDGTYGVPAKAVYIRNIVLGSEFLMSSITHFYHLAAPSYVQGPAIPPWTPYFAAADYNPALLSGGRAVPDNTEGFSDDVWSTVIRSYVTALRIRRLTFEAGALFAGRMPMTSCYVGGGVTFDKSADLSDRCDKFRAVMEEVGRFIVKEYVPIVLALGKLYLPWDNSFNGGSNYGAGVGNFLAWGAFPIPEGANKDKLTLPGGVWTGGNAGSLSFGVANKAQVLSQFVSGSNSVPTNLREDITNSRYADTLGEYGVAPNTSNQAYPGAVSRTEPNRANGYTYSKAPRWAGNPMEVGPLARLVVGGMYPLNGVALAGTVPGYTAYVKTAGTTTGLDPRMIAADIAVALVRDGLATLTLDDGVAAPAVVDATALAGLNNAQIVAAYTSADAVITGTIKDWVIGLKGGLSTMDRLRARGLESLVLVQALIGAYDKVSDTFRDALGEEASILAPNTTYFGYAEAMVADDGDEDGALVTVLANTDSSVPATMGAALLPSRWQARAYRATDIADASTYTLVGNSDLASVAAAAMTPDIPLPGDICFDGTVFRAYVPAAGTGNTWEFTSANGTSWAASGTVYTTTGIQYPAVVSDGTTTDMYYYDGAGISHIALTVGNATPGGATQVIAAGQDPAIEKAAGGEYVLTYQNHPDGIWQASSASATGPFVGAQLYDAGYDSLDGLASYKGSVIFTARTGPQPQNITNKPLLGVSPVGGWINGLKNATGDTWKDKPIPVGEFQGWGATEAPRGALMHQCTIVNGKITKYQCIVPTTWNMSPKDNANKRGPIEQAMINVPYAGNNGSFTKQNGTAGSGQGGVEALRVAQSFDPCIACAVH